MDRKGLIDYEARKMSVACFEMARLLPEECEEWINQWIDLGVDWSFASPFKNPKGWQTELDEALAATEKLPPLDKVAVAFGAYTVAAQVVSMTKAKCEKESAIRFGERYANDESETIAYVSDLNRRAIEKIRERSSHDDA